MKNIIPIALAATLAVASTAGCARTEPPTSTPTPGLPTDGVEPNQNFLGPAPLRVGNAYQVWVLGDGTPVGSDGSCSRYDDVTAESPSPEGAKRPPAYRGSAVVCGDGDGVLTYGGITDGGEHFFGFSDPVD